MVLSPTERRRWQAEHDSRLDCDADQLAARRKQREADRKAAEADRRWYRQQSLSPTSRAKLEARRAEREDADHAQWLAACEAAEAEWDAIQSAFKASNYDDTLSDEQADAALAAYQAAISDWRQRSDALYLPRKHTMKDNVVKLPTVAKAAPLPPLIQSSGKFVADFVAPSYLLDGILQRRFCYALTAATGAGKTAIALRLAAHVALGRKLGDRDVEQGRVLYFASENSVDVQARWIAAAQHIGFDPNAIEVYFVAGQTRLSEIADRITREAQAIGDLALIIVDTSAATFEGADENGNVDALIHAKRMRSLTSLQGGPTVLVLCHPVKNATNENLAPRGGGAFVAEIDGNLCARKTDSAVELHWSVKFRGMDFAPLLFRLDTVTAAALRDAKGRHMPTVLATPMDAAAKDAMSVAQRRDEDAVLHAIDKNPGASANKLAEALDWKMGNGQPYGVRVRRAAEKLERDGLITKHRGNWVLTKLGQVELNRGTTVVPPMLPSPAVSSPNM